MDLGNHKYIVVGIYSQCSTQDQREELLVNACEEAMSEENSGWGVLLKK